MDINVCANSCMVAASGWDLQRYLGIQSAPLPEWWGLCSRNAEPGRSFSPAWSTSHRRWFGSRQPGQWPPEKIGTCSSLSVSVSPLCYPTAKVQPGIWVKRTALQHPVNTTRVYPTFATAVAQTVLYSAKDPTGISLYLLRLSGNWRRKKNNPQTV